MFADDWQYPHGDPSIRLFDLAMKMAREKAGLDLPPECSVLELGARETDFARWFKQARPQSYLVANDVGMVDGPYDAVFVQPAESLMLPLGMFDAVVALGSIEHFGLGYYGDPENATADIEVACRVRRMLKVGGWFYYDVPWTPNAYYVTENRHFRVYDEEARYHRLNPSGAMETVCEFWANPEVNHVYPERPREAHPVYWYCATVLRRVR